MEHLSQAGGAYIDEIAKRCKANAEHARSLRPSAEDERAKRIEIVRGQSEIPAAYLSATLGDARNATEENRAAWDAAKAFVQRGFVRPGVGLYGPVGAGKSHIAAAIGNAAVMAERRTIMLTTTQLVLRLRATFSTSDESEYTLIQRLVHTPVLIVDDLGKEQITEWSAQNLFDFFNERWNLGLPVVVVANLSPGQLKQQKYAKTPEGVDPSLMTAVLDRIWGMTGEWHKVDGKSMRRGVA